MSHEQENARPTDNLADEGGQEFSAGRGGWREQEHTRVDLDECTDARCKNVDANVGYQGLADDEWLTRVGSAAERGKQSVGDDLRAAWKTQLEREGKQSSEAKSLRDTVFGSSEPKQ